MPTGVYPRTEYHRKINSLSHKGLSAGKNNHFYGVHKYGKDAPHYGKPHSEETRKKISQKLTGKPQPWNEKENHPNWRGGISFEPYTVGWTEDLKESIRKRDNWTCQKCGRTQGKGKRKLSVHHIDYVKENLNPTNLITLCGGCNTKANFNREDWIKYFQGIMEND